MLCIVAVMATPVLPLLVPGADRPAGEIRIDDAYRAIRLALLGGDGAEFAHSLDQVGGPVPYPIDAAARRLSEPTERGGTP